MPFVRISVESSTPAATRKLIADSVYEAMRETIGIPEGDRFIVVTAHEAADMFIDPSFMGAARSHQFVLTQIFLSRGRTVEQKQALYARIVERLHEAAGIPADDVMIVLTENNFEDWSFGKGQAQYVLNPPAWARKAEEGN
ncbi:tautomerase family protein [Acidicapsa dinghuensis]|uniref:Tautomerase family protein n=1 Tax=Acidicapsa dinghuensis TaxID=2218256 RepID=A0ABW1EE27_9BACT|nr:tautomerase family protein [Acidicapsa dinghuensis]